MMSKEYFKKLSELTKRTSYSGFKDIKLEVKHFFSGAALYANGKICATLTPKGFAIKLPENNRDKLLKEGKAKKLRYFPKAPIKKDYVILPKAMTDNLKIFGYYIKISINNVIKEGIKK